jgi:hypothetical protein
MLRARVLALFVLRSGACAWMAGCAADPGDAPKSEDRPIPSASDAAIAPDAAGAEIPDAQVGGEGALDAGAVAEVGSAASDSSGESGSPDVGSSDGTAPDAPVLSTCTLCPLVVEYMTPTTASTTGDIALHVEIANNGTSDENLSALTLRYWFTADGSASQAFACDYAVVGCGDVQAKFAAMAAPAAAADHYLELSFRSGAIAAGASTGEIQARFHDSSYAVTFTQTNDYSFNAADTAYAPWNHITLYRGGTLVFGVEP